MKTPITYRLVFLPLKHLRLTSAYGYHIHPLTVTYAFHAATDLLAKRDPIYAIMSGTGYAIAWTLLSGLVTGA